MNENYKIRQARVEELPAIADIEAGVSSINCVGDFSKFFTSVEDTFLKIEMTNSNISILR